MPLDRRTAKQQINLVIVIAVTAQILNHSQTGFAVRNRRIQVVLLAGMVDAEALEGQVATGAELRLNGARMENGRFHAHVRHAAFNHVELDGDYAGHLDGAAEGDFAIALREVQVADGEFGAGNVHWEIYLAAAAEVFDVAVPAVLGAALYDCLFVGTAVRTLLLHSYTFMGLASYLRE